MKTNTRSIRSVLATGITIAVSCAATPLLADAPQAVTIETQVQFDERGLAFGTFAATGPICSTGTLRGEDGVFAAGGAAFNVNALHVFVCDDNSGSFVLRVHPQGNGRPKDGFVLNGPWSVWGKGTGAYESLSGHGEFGVMFDFTSDPLEGNETYVGFVNLQ